MTENYVTLFDSRFLPQGLVLYESLRRHSPEARLWVVALDEATARYLRDFPRPGLRVIALAEIETADLRAKRAQRTWREYCWTLSPFLPAAVLERAPGETVTYVDADLYFLASPRTLLDELTASGRDVLITDHGYAPQYRQAKKYGRFCVQFVTFRDTAGAREVLGDWQAKCLEWCHAYPSEGRFGDQKYLDAWPERFASFVHVFSRPELTLGPWNVAWRARTRGVSDAVFYHFHGLRLFREGTQLWRGYRVGEVADPIYRRYLGELSDALARLRGDVGYQLSARERGWGSLTDRLLGVAGLCRFGPGL